MFKYSELDKNNKSEIVGESYKLRANEIMRLLKKTNTPLMFTGYSGTGKTHIAKNIAIKYAIKNNVPAYFMQLSPDQTKTNVILGLRLVGGSLVPHKGVVSECMQQGGIIIIDEATHATQSLLLMFNSLMDREATTSIGDEIIIAKDSFRIIFCCNNSDYSGNIKLPQSFCNRLITYNFDYPSFEEEIEITKLMLCKSDIKYDEKILNYFLKIMREIREREIPLSVRNIHSAMLLLSLKKYKLIKSDEIKYTGDMEAKFKKILFLMGGYKSLSDITKNDILNEETMLMELYSIGFLVINEIMKQSFMYYLDFDGSIYSKDTFKTKLEGYLL